MLCENCQEKTADVLVTRLIDGAVAGRQLCQTCAEPTLKAIAPDEIAGATFLSPPVDHPLPESVDLPKELTVRDFAARLHLHPYQVVATLMRLGVFVSSDGLIDATTASQVCSRYGVETTYTG